ncbi:MAG: ABC transporter ATP-binding protein [Phycisphaeraceae bacterium]|nr:ABC transporter ATP-binding protein [Phycisphaeraceae bacterium]
MRSSAIVTNPQEREPNQRPLDMRLIQRLFTFTRPYAAKRNWLFALVIIRSMQLPLLAWSIGAIIAGPVNGKRFDDVLLATSGFALLAIVTSVCFHFRQKLALELGEAVVHDLRARIFEKLQQMPMAFYDKTRLGRIISRMTSDAEAVRQGVQDVMFVTMVQVGQMIVAAIVMLWYDWVLFLVVLVMAPGLLWLSQYFRVKLGDAWREVQESFSRITANLAESVNGIRVTQGFVRQDTNAEFFRWLVEDHSVNNMRAARLSGIFLPLLELNNQFFIAVLLLLGGYQVLAGGLGGHPDPHQQFEALVVFFFMVNMFFGPIAAIGRQYTVALTAMAGAERVFHLLDSDPGVVDPPHALMLPPIRGRIEFRDVCFSYEPGKPVLEQINFTAQPGQMIALVGQTGSGKSTIIRLISKFYQPSSGQILVDGHDLRQIKTEPYIDQLGIVLQQNFVFTGTVMDNIRVGKLDATDEQVFEAARKLDCFDLLEALPNGFYTQVGEGGGSLSLGQRQLVCFTRAMLADPRILIFDEATSSVDTMTEARIQKALSVLLAGRSSFVVAHRLSTIRHASMVLVLDHGRLIEQGTHTELLTQGGIYASLYREFIHGLDT